MSTTILSTRAMSTAPETRASMTLTAVAEVVDVADETGAVASTGQCSQCGSFVHVARLGSGHDHGHDHDSMDSKQQLADELKQARLQIRDLEAQLRLLNERTAEVTGRWADGEEELARLRRRPSVPAAGAAVPPPPTVRSSFLPAGAASRLSALLSPRTAKSTPNLKKAADIAAAAATTPPPPPRRPTAPGTPPPSATATAYSHSYKSSFSTAASSSPSVQTTAAAAAAAAAAASAAAASSMQALLASLSHEKTLRRQAESRLQNTSREVEELSVSLFEQANEMVAEERRQRARLEERVAVLEQRDADKRKRLDRLEQAVGRIDRVRALLAQAEEKAAQRAAEIAAGEDMLDEEGRTAEEMMEETRTEATDTASDYGDASFTQEAQSTELTEITEITELAETLEVARDTRVLVA
ncbi:hypothetical protein CMQ_2709 [Grosmannia clavigera kw1407]|uniref:GDP/GTP exchange factor Sec2 N-terminal domain-containing protein n=1 Tax=Grosmannia clavigera (strain kw1407 / UAMH 11150) TaxID=655863 RepID=F0XIB7_GROCL|nr:uncharacterized protein CMQ_2709 [Grosmannia clavigera kw1407]EFX02780.1 hypothetical protein CMQ_2709 [Grosmannia clavigera kw1407]